MKLNNIVLIGGANIDYIATPNSKLINGVSNIGKISSSFGGVMRNVSENLARLGCIHAFISAIGKDDNGCAIIKQLKTLGVNVISKDTNLPTGTYLAINDDKHDLALAVCDNRIISSIDSDFIDENKNIIRNASYILIDSNLEEETIKKIMDEYSDKLIMADAISPTKVKKYLNYIDKFYLLKCNIFEARAILNDDNISPFDACEKIGKMGVKNFVLSTTTDDIYYSESGNIGKYIVKKEKEVVNTTGCGDALFSGIVNELIKGKKLYDAISFGQNLAVLTLKVETATSKEVEKYRYKM